jgi:hypothetical protein
LALGGPDRWTSLVSFRRGLDVSASVSGVQHAPWANGGMGRQAQSLANCPRSPVVVSRCLRWDRRLFMAEAPLPHVARHRHDRGGVVGIMKIQLLRKKRRQKNREEKPDVSQQESYQIPWFYGQLSAKPNKSVTIEPEQARFWKALIEKNWPRYAHAPTKKKGWRAEIAVAVGFVLGVLVLLFFFAR